MKTDMTVHKDGTSVISRKEKYDYTIFIGRFQPFHLEHARVIDEALSRSKTLILCIGSAQHSRRLRNPFTFEERCEMIKAQYPLHSRQHRIIFVPIEDMTYRDDQWVAQVQAKVDAEIFAAGWTETPPSVALIGCKKDNTSYFLSLFPQWDSISIDFKNPINATDIRRDLYGHKAISINVMHAEARNKMYDLIDADGGAWLDELVHEYMFVQEYKAQWKVKETPEDTGVPFPVTFSTVDAIVVQSGHVLLIKRGQMPQKGKLAIPGGFLNQNETLYEGALRELREETGLKLSDFSLKAALKKREVFDDPHRGERGRIITTAFLFKLEDRPFLPPVVGQDDAAEAMWVPISQLKANDMMSDHYHIIQTMIGA